MSRQTNAGGGGWFRRLTREITEPIRRVLRRPKVEKPPKPSSFAKAVRPKSSKAPSGVVKGTTQRIPHHKYSDFEYGWRDPRKPTGRIIKPVGIFKEIAKIEPQTTIEIGKDHTATAEQLAQIEKFVDEYNIEIEQIRLELFDEIRKHLDPIASENTILTIQDVVDRKEMKFDRAEFDDLRDLDFQQFANKILEGKDFDQTFDLHTSKIYYNIKERQELYRENYIKAMYNALGETSETKELAERLMSMDISKFMVSYYDLTSTIQIDYWYPEGTAEDPRVQRVHDYFDKMERTADFNKRVAKGQALIDKLKKYYN